MFFKHKIPQKFFVQLLGFITVWVPSFIYSSYIDSSKPFGRVLLFLQVVDETVYFDFRHMLHHHYMRQLASERLVVALRQVVLAADRNKGGVIPKNQKGLRPNFFDIIIPFMHA